MHTYMQTARLPASLCQRSANPCLAPASCVQAMLLASRLSRWVAGWPPTRGWVDGRVVEGSS